MKRIFALFICLIIVFSISACGWKAPEETTPPQTTLPAQTQATENIPETTAPVISLYTAPMSAISMPLVEETETAEDGTELFTYTYQNVFPMMQDPDIAKTVSLDLLNRIDATRASAEEIRSAAIADYRSSNWNPYFYAVYYNPMRIDQGILSLFGNRVSYQGSAHPSYVSISATYDLVTGKALEFSNVLTEDYSAEQLSQLICDALADNSQLYDDYETVVKDRFSGDSNSSENWYLSTQGLCIYFSPYDIAPYAAGTITATIPYSQLNGILRDEFFPAERGNSGGSIIQAPFQTAQLDQFQQFTEVILDRNAEVYLLYTDGQLFDVTLETGTYSEKYDSFTPLSTVFACEALSMNDAIMVQSDDVLRLTYQSGDSTVSTILK